MKNEKLTTDEYDALGHIERGATHDKVNACVGRNAKRLSGLKLIQYGKDGRVALTDKGQQALFLALAAGREFKLIHLVTPTTPRVRAAVIARRSTGFLYCVSVAGITGERDRLPPELLDQLAWLRKQTPLPLCVGFGVSRPEHVRMLREAADGVIVGSALVRKLDQSEPRPFEQSVCEMGELAQALAAALNG